MAHAGFVSGRRMPLHIEAAIVRMYQEGATYVAIRAVLGVSDDAIRRVRKHHGLQSLNPKGMRAEPFSVRSLIRYKRTRRAKCVS